MADPDPAADPTADATPADLALWSQALRQDWAIPPKVKRRLLQVAIDLADPDDEESPGRWSKSSTDEDDHYTLAERVAIESKRKRVRASALRVVSQFMGLTLEQQKLDFLRERYDEAKGRGETVKFADLVAEAEAVFEQRKKDRNEGQPE